MELSDALEQVYEKYGRANVEFDPLTRKAKVKGVGIIYVGKRITMKQRLVADLHATGLSMRGALRLIKPEGTAHAHHYGQVMRSPMMEAHTEANVKAITEEARAKLFGAVDRAASNVVDKVNEGDYHASVKVLAGTGVLVQKSEKEVTATLSFGEWLSGTQQEKTIEAFDESHQTLKQVQDASPAEVVEPVEVMMGVPDSEPDENMPVLPSD